MWDERVREGGRTSTRPNADLARHTRPEPQCPYSSKAKRPKNQTKKEITTKNEVSVSKS